MRRVLNVIVFGVLFLLVVTPVALLLRVLGKDLLRLRRDDRATSYWVDRQPPGPAPETLKRQM